LVEIGRGEEDKLIVLRSFTTFRPKLSKRQLHDEQDVGRYLEE
jgi:hypothetical protein